MIYPVVKPVKVGSFNIGRKGFPALWLLSNLKMWILWEVDATLIDEWNLGTFAQFQGSKMSLGLLQDFMDEWIEYYDFSL